MALRLHALINGGTGAGAGRPGLSRPVWLALMSVCAAGLVVAFGQYTPSRAAAADSPAPIVMAPPPPDEDLASAPLLVGAGDGPEGRLLQAYAALAAGHGRKATALAAALVQDHPQFGLAQLLHGDLLATRGGAPQVFGVAAQVTATAQAEHADLALLREEARRRLSALRERPPADHLPRELVDLPAHVRHAVAVDTERSRLYLFSNGPQGLQLEKDFFVSLGKQGIAKSAQGDARTPLGVYWVVNALPSHMLAERFGSAALGINYPNAIDRQKGRTGTGLFVHGVPPSVYSHGLWATDGCVALANDDANLLLKRLAVDESPVVIARKLEWVPRHATRQAAAEFRPAYQAWDDARRAGDVQDIQRWYDPTLPAPRHTTGGMAPRSNVSFLAWYGETTPMMVVSTREEGRSKAEAATTYRQYWAQQDGRWRIVYDGPVINTLASR